MFDKMQSIDRRWIFLALVLAVVIPLLKPLGLPISISKETQGVYDIIESLPAGSVIVISADYGASSLAEVQPMGAAIAKHAFKKGHKILLLTIAWDQGPKLLHDEIMKAAQAAGKSYGTDYVNIGWKAGNDLAIRQMIDTGIYEGAVGVDYSGADLKTFPLTSDPSLVTLKDVDYLISLAAGTPGYEWWVAYLGEAHKINVGAGVVAVSAPAAYNFYKAAQLKGLLVGMRGAAEYEVMSRAPGAAVKGMDAQSFAHVLILVLIILGNVGYLMGRRAKAA